MILGFLGFIMYVVDSLAAGNELAELKHYSVRHVELPLPGGLFPLLPVNEGVVPLLVDGRIFALNGTSLHICSR